MLKILNWGAACTSYDNLQREARVLPSKATTTHQNAQLNVSSVFSGFFLFEVNMLVLCHWLSHRPKKEFLVTCFIVLTLDLLSLFDRFNPRVASNSNFALHQRVGRLLTRWGLIHLVEAVMWAIRKPFRPKEMTMLKL